MAGPATAWMDATVELGHAGARWPGDEPFSLAWTARLGDRGPLGVNLSRFTTSPHNGTHADAPFHVLRDGHKSEGFPLEPFIGPCVVVDVTRTPGHVVPASLGGKILRSRPERVLFKTRRRVPDEFGGHAGIHPDLAQRLVDGGVRLIGIDSPSVDRADLFGLSSHRAIFGAGAYNLESLDLSKARPGSYDLHAPPLKVAGLCAAPVRALLRRAR